MVRIGWMRGGLTRATTAIAAGIMMTGAVAALALMPVTSAAAKRPARGARVLAASPREEAANPAPAVTIDTGARGGTGIRIEGPTPQFDAFYPGDPGKWLHILVLNREDLALVSDTSYDCPEATIYPYPSQVDQLKPCIDKVKIALGKLENGKHTNLVIATSQYDGKDADGQPPVGMSQALGPSLGTKPWTWYHSNERVVRGTYSAVGVAGLPKLGIEKVGGQSAPGSGRMIDNLVRDNELNYGLAPGEPVEFDTQASGSDAQRNVIQIGYKRYEYGVPRPDDLWGIEVVTADGQTLEAKSYFFDVARDPKRWADLADTLHAVNDSAAVPFSRPQLVFVATRGPLRSPSRPLSDAEKRAVVRVADDLTNDGGTRTRFMDAFFHSTVSNPVSYTLVGGAASGTGSGLEAVGKPKSGATLNTVPLTGTLARTGPYYNHTVQSAGNAFSQTAGKGLFTGTIQLLQTIGRLQSDWPGHGNPDQEAAIAYLGEQVLGTKDPRAEYWTTIWKPGEWDKISAKIETEPCPPTLKECDWAKKELTDEIGWLNTEHEYLDDRAAPFHKDALESWAQLQTIASKIDKEVKSPDKTTEAQAAAITEFAVDLGEEVPLIGKAVAASAAIYRFAVDNAKIGGEPVGDRFAVKTAEAGEELVKRMTSAEDYLSVQVPNVIASDYERLKIVGSCASPLKEEQAGCPKEFDPSDWKYTPDDQKYAAEGLLDGSKVAAYAALLPAKYNLWRLPPNTDPRIDKYAGRTVIPPKCWYPFKDEPLTGYALIPKTADLDGEAQITGLGFMTGAGKFGDLFEMHVPEASVTDPLFGDLSGELGVNKEEFFARFFRPASPLEHYPEDTSPTGWDVLGCR